MGSIDGWISPSQAAAQFAEPQYENAKISVWWDIENCEVPKKSDPHCIAQNVSSALVKMKYCGPVSTISSYGDTTRLPSSVQQALNSTGISLNHVPAGAKDASDKKILVDMLLWAVDNPAPANYLLISGDRDFSNALHQLRMRRYNIILAQPKNASAPLVAAARSVWLWTTLCDGGPPLTKDETNQIVKTQSNSSVTDTPRNYPLDGSKPSMDSSDIKQIGNQSKMNNGSQLSVPDCLSNDGKTFDTKQKGKQIDGSQSSSDSLSNDGGTFDTKQKGMQSKLNNGSQASTDNLSNHGRPFDTKQKGKVSNGSQSGTDSLPNDGKTSNIKPNGKQSAKNSGGQKGTPVRVQDSKTNINKINMINDGSSELSMESLWRVFSGKTKSNVTLILNQRKPKREFHRCSVSLDKVLDVLIKNNLVKIVEPRPEKLQSPKQLDQTKFCKYHQTFGHNTNVCFTLKSKIQDLIDEGVILKKNVDS
ncbi:uncharacterized protein LOC124924328 [Impatiens glandulifera]|uniref:uncharacterized protein LOC124924328 n=1 Tax=Impatiens glandulifera TaxID=253017 RepID=UPI001FB1088E|nr:uncharacterized protein LOC124924328 [Impatiens glandulifera]